MMPVVKYLARAAHSSQLTPLSQLTRKSQSQQQQGAALLAVALQLNAFSCSAAGKITSEYGGGAEAPSNPRLVGRSSGGKRKKSPTKTDSESSDSDTGEALVVALEVPPLREKRNLKRQRLQDTPTAMKRDLTTLEERQWISSKKKFIRKVRRFAGTAASTWMKKRSRRTATAAASPNRDRAKKHRNYVSPERRRREFGPSQPTSSSSLNPALAPNRPTSRTPRTFGNPDAQV